MTLTKKQLINALYNLDVPDNTIVVKSSGIGFEDINDVHTQTVVNRFVDKESEILTIVLD